MKGLLRHGSRPAFHGRARTMPRPALCSSAATYSAHKRQSRRSAGPGDRRLQDSHHLGIRNAGLGLSEQAALDHGMEHSKNNWTESSRIASRQSGTHSADSHSVPDALNHNECAAPLAGSRPSSPSLGRARMRFARDAAAAERPITGPRQGALRSSAASGFRALRARVPARFEGRQQGTVLTVRRQRPPAYVAADHWADPSPRCHITNARTYPCSDPSAQAGAPGVRRRVACRLRLP
jgi:hypothetical protein